VGFHLFVCQQEREREREGNGKTEKNKYLIFSQEMVMHVKIVPQLDWLLN